MREKAQRERKRKRKRKRKRENRKISDKISSQYCLKPHKCKSDLRGDSETAWNSKKRMSSPILPFFVCLNFLSHVDDVE